MRSRGACVRTGTVICVSLAFANETFFFRFCMAQRETHKRNDTHTSRRSQSWESVWTLQCQAVVASEKRPSLCRNLRKSARINRAVFWHSIEWNKQISVWGRDTPGEEKDTLVVHCGVSSVHQSPLNALREERGNSWGELCTELLLSCSFMVFYSGNTRFTSACFSHWSSVLT